MATFALQRAPTLLILATFVFLFSESGWAKSISIETPVLKIELDDQGNISGLTSIEKNVRYKAASLVELEPLARGALARNSQRKPDEKLVAAQEPGKITFTRDLGSSGTVVSTFSAEGNAIHWQVDVTGKQGIAPYSVPISTGLQISGAAHPLFWAAYDGGTTTSWVDPLTPWPFRKRSYEYGSYYRRGGGISLPLATFIDRTRQVGISLAEAPSDPFLTMDCRTNAQANMQFIHRNYRISSRSPVHLNLYITAHEPDCRSALGWMVNMWPEFFNPPNPIADKVGGGAAYSGYEGMLDAVRLKKMSFHVNWKASIDFPYMGMYLPPISPETKWNRFAGGGRGHYGPGDEGRFGQTSIAELAHYSSRMNDQGFDVLSYFNITEFGGNIIYPPPPHIADVTTTQPLWKDPNAFLYSRFPDALLKEPGVRHTWGGAVVMDCGDVAYQDFLLKQAQRHIDEIPNAIGICIDRLDWVNHYNRSADDGVSWLDDAPARYLGVSWRKTMSRLGPLMHKAGKVVFLNPLYHRLDFLRQADGIYDEKGDMGVALDSSTFMALRKPLMAWVHDEKWLKPDPDAFMQRYLYMGAFLTVPVQGNDHSIVPSPWADAQYLKYGPLFNKLRGRKWVLRANPVSVQCETSSTKANVFEIPGGFVVPVVFATGSKTATVTLHGFGGRQFAETEAVLPGKDHPVAIKAESINGDVTFKTPLDSGCAMVVLRTNASD